VEYNIEYCDIIFYTTIMIIMLFLMHYHLCFNSNLNNSIGIIFLATVFVIAISLSIVFADVLQLGVSCIRQIDGTFQILCVQKILKPRSLIVSLKMR